MKTGFLGGSFDPIHFGHISLAVHLLEEHHLNEVLFCPAQCSPFKMGRQPQVSNEHRLNMLKLSLDHPQFKICTLELERAAPSYTIDTLRQLKGGLHLLLSEEAAKDFHQWKEFETIKKLAPLLVGPRQVPISSTEIRQRLKKRLYCGHLVPAKALDYILANGLYC